MDQAAPHPLENLSLSNLNQKMKMLRDHLRQSVQEDIVHLKNKVENIGTYNQENNSTPPYYEQNLLTQGHSSESQEEFNWANHKSSQQLSKQNPGSYTQNSEKQPCPTNQPQYYRYVSLAGRQVDLQQIKFLSSKNFSAEEARSYIKCVLSQDIWQKLEQLWLQYEDEKHSVQLRQFVNRLFRLSLHYIEAIAFQIPKIKKKISLKKVLFQIAYKHRIKKGQKITLQEFKDALQNYKYQPSPTIDQIISQLESQKQHLLKNHLIIPQQVVTELKNIYKRSSSHHFLHYCSSAALISKLQTSRIMEMHMDTEVRRKSHLQASKTIKEIVYYMKQKSPQFIDLDQFLLYFSTYPFAFYPIEEREVLYQNQQTFKAKKQSKLQRFKSLKNLSKQQKQKRISKHVNTLHQYYQTKKENIQRALQLKQQHQTAELQYKFKARPLPKTLSEEKYRQFLSKLQQKKQEMRIKQLKQNQKSQKIIERLKSQTKLLQSPKHPKPSISKQSFRARPVPEQVFDNKLKDIEAQKRQRKNKIMSLNKEKYNHQWKQLPQVATHRQHSPKKLQPKQNFNTQHYYFKQIPDYKAQQDRIRWELEQRKKKFMPTKIQQFNLHTEQRHPQNNCKHKNEYYIQQPVYYLEQEYDYKQYLYSPKPQIYYTQKFTDMMAANKNRAFQRELSFNKQLQDEEERQKKHQNFAKFMKVPLSKIPNTAKICELQGKLKVQRHKKYWKKLDAQYQNDLNQLYAKVIKRPFLYEMQSIYSKQNKLEPTITPENQPKKKKKQKNKHKASQNRYKDTQVMNRSF